METITGIDNPADSMNPATTSRAGESIGRLVRERGSSEGTPTWPGRGGWISGFSETVMGSRSRMSITLSPKLAGLGALAIAAALGTVAIAQTASSATTPSSNVRHVQKAGTADYK